MRLKTERYLEPRRQAAGTYTYRWMPRHRDRGAGWPVVACRVKAGAWFDLPRAETVAAAWNARLDAFRVGKGPGPAQLMPDPITALPVPNTAAATASHHRPPHGALADAWRRLQAHRDFSHEIGDRTREQYYGAWKRIEPIFGDIDCRAIGTPECDAFYQGLLATTGKPMAASIMAGLSRILSHAILIGWITVNPVQGVKIRKAPPRVVLWRPEEIDHLVRTADLMRLPSVGTAVVIAADLGARGGDIVLFKEGEHYRSGQFSFAAAKGKHRNARPIFAPATPRIRERLEIQAKLRRLMSIESDYLVAYEATKARYTTYNQLGKAFRRVAKAATADMPSMQGKTFQDFRDTCVTRLAEAGNTIPQICSVTGHSLAGATEVLKHYLATTETQAREAIERMVTYEEQKLAIA